MKKVIFLFLMLLFFLPQPCFVKAEGEIGPMPSDFLGKMAWLKSVFGDVIGKENDPTKHFYGVVVDQYSAPVVGVELNASWSYISWDLRDKIKKITLTTDTAGRFDFTPGYFETPCIGDLKKKGYEFIWDHNLYSRSDERTQSELISKSSTTPVVFTLRKMGLTTYLYSLMDNRVQIKAPTYLGAYNIFEPHTKPIKELGKLSNPDRYDLLFETAKTDMAYQLRVKPVKKPASFQFSDQLLYEAPASGYLPEAVLELPFSDKERVVYLYFTSRNPGVYSRMKIQIWPDPKELRLSFRTWTNPYGSRNLEYEPDLPADLHKKLRHEAEAALKSGKLPPEPDIPAMIASGLYK